MARLTIYKDNDIDCTMVANLFIDEYMKDSNDAQLKIYLYLLRMMNAHLATSVSDIADKFNHTEKEVVRALKYWEKYHLIDLDYDEDKTLIGIHMRDLTDADSVRRRRRTAPSTFIPMPATDVPAAEKVIPSSDDTAYETAVAEVSERSFEAPAPAVPQQAPAPSFQKKNYSTAQLREFNSNESISQLFFIASSYIGKPLSTAEMNSILFFSDVLHFSDDLIDHLLQYCVDKGKKDFKYIEKVAIGWAEQGITTPEEAKRNSHQYDKAYYAIMKELGKTNAITPKEAEYITRWIREYGYSNDIIFEACARTVMATERNRFEYAERILKRWHEQQVHHLEDIARVDEQFKQKKQSSSSGTSSAKPSSTRFSQFTQNAYDFDTLEKELLSN